MRDLNAVLERLAALKAPGKAIIDGALTPAASGATFANISPRDGSRINDVASCDAGDVDRTVAAARKSFEDGRWRALSPREKKKILFRLADLMEADADNLALLESLDTGKPISEARNVDIPLSIQTTRYYAEALDKIYGEVGPVPEGRFSYATHEPLGVIGAIVPWNFPLHMAMWKVAPALAMGNSVVLKPAEQSPMTALKLGELWAIPIMLRLALIENLRRMAVGVMRDGVDHRLAYEWADLVICRAGALTIAELSAAPQVGVKGKRLRLDVQSYEAQNYLGYLQGRQLEIEGILLSRHFESEEIQGTENSQLVGVSGTILPISAELQPLSGFIR